jgi:hypothetical protein
MKYVFIFFLGLLLVGCSVFLKDEKEIDKIVEDVVHEEITHPLI